MSFSPLFALFIRSLREDSRLRMTYLARAALALVILLFLSTTNFGAGLAGMNAGGLWFFTAVIVIDFGFVILAGVSYFSSAISEEKEEMTLGLLRMTNLNPLSILLGKSTSRLCTAILFLAAQIPFTLLAITLGGISLNQVAAAYVAVASFLILVSNLALLFSVICQRSISAAIMTGIALFFFLALLPLVTFLAQLPVSWGLLTATSAWVQALEAVGSFALLASPFPRLGAIFGTGFQENPFSFQAWSNIGLGVGCFLLSWALFERYCSEQKEATPTRIAAGPARRGWQWLSPSRAWGRALAWKDFYFLSGGKLWMTIKFVIYGLPLVGARSWPDIWGGPMDWENLGVLLFWLMGGFICVELAFAAATVFRTERQGQTLSSLAMLPQGIRRVAYQKVLGILPSLVPAASYMLLGALMMSKIIGELFREVGSNWHDWMSLVAICFAFAQAAFFLHLVANLSLRVKRGALPLAIGLQFILSMVVMIGLVGIFHGDSALFVLLFMAIAATVYLHHNIGQRLEELAGEE